MPSYYVVIQYSYCTPAHLLSSNSLVRVVKFGPSVKYFGFFTAQVAFQSYFNIK